MVRLGVCAACLASVQCSYWFLGDSATTGILVLVLHLGVFTAKTHICQLLVPEKEWNVEIQQMHVKRTIGKKVYTACLY